MNYIGRFILNRSFPRVQSTFVRYEHGLESSHKVNNLEKKFLVWTGKYKNVAEVPPYVTQSTMERCRNRMRIKIANYMMFATALGCIVMIYLGKQDAKKGITLAQQNKDWHAQMKAQQQANETK